MDQCPRGKAPEGKWYFLISSNRLHFGAMDWLGQGRDTLVV